VTDGAAIVALVRASALLEPDLARWIGAAVWNGLAPARRRRIRDDLLREAARRLPPDSVWQKAHRIAELARRADARPGVSSAAGLVALARGLYRPERRDRDLSPKQLFRILADFPISPVEMEVGGDAPSDETLGIFPEREDDNGKSTA
jgi:hypothetical protein